MSTPMKTRGVLSVLQDNNPWSTAPNSREKFNSLLNRNNELVTELLKSREALHRRTREIAALRLELLLRANDQQKSSPEGKSPERKRTKKVFFMDKASQTEPPRVMSPFFGQENAPLNATKTASPSEFRVSSPIRMRQIASPAPTKSPLPAKPVRGGRRKQFRGTDSLQFLSRGLITSIREHSDDEMEL